MSKVNGKDFLLKPVNLENFEGSSFFIPANNVRKGGVLSDGWITYKISYVLAMKMEGRETFSLLFFPTRRLSL